MDTLAEYILVGGAKLRDIVDCPNSFKHGLARDGAVFVVFVGWLWHFKNAVKFVFLDRGFSLKV